MLCIDLYACNNNNFSITLVSSTLDNIENVSH